MKIKFLPNWCSSEEGTKRLFDQFYTDQDLENVTFVFDDSFDVIFYCGYVRGEIPPPEIRKYIFNMEPAWSGNVQRHNSHIDATIYAQDRNIFSDPSKVIECPTFMFYGSGGENWTIEDTRNDYSKTRNISCIISNRKNDQNIRGCLYDDRYRLVDALIDSETPIDVFGRKSTKPNSAGGLPRKLEGLKPYKFSICVENSREQNYITEKFYDCILTNTVPIYFGASNIKEIFPQNGYFAIEDLTDINGILSTLSYINSNVDKLYEEMLPGVKEIKDKFFTEYNLLTKILNIANDQKSNRILG